jgi:contractile injection system tube protein
MPAKAQLVEINWEKGQAEPVRGKKSVEVQFNPQTLRLSHANQNKGGEQPGNSSKQFVGSKSSKLSVELLFDTTEAGTDVREKTKDVGYFLGAKVVRGVSAKKTPPRVPPGLQFEWGTFIFRGIVDSMEETLDYFSERGIPMRATVTLGVTQQDIEFNFGQPGPAGPGGPAAGTPAAEPRESARPGDSVQQMAGRSGRSDDWKAIAAANDIDDPLRVPPGSLVDMNPARRR